MNEAHASVAVADFIRGLSFSHLPESVLHRAKLCILDAVGCALAATDTPIAGKVKASFKHSLGSCSMWGGSATGSPEAAAFFNATLINALDFDDDNGVGHPTATILPALFAACEIQAASGRDFLTAFVAGYEVSTRIGRAAWPSVRRYLDVWGVGTHQVFGAAAAVGKIYDLQFDSMLDALGIAGSAAPVPSAMKWGWNSEHLSWIKDAVSWPSACGLTAATLAREGMIGCRDILDGKHGFWMMAASDQWRPAEVLDSLGERFSIMDGAFKPYPCCRYAHSTLEAIERLRQREALAVDEISGITVESISDLQIYMNNRRPRDAIAAQFSMPYLVGAMLVHGRLTPAEFTQSRLTDPAIYTIADMVELVANRSYDEIYNSTHNRLCADLTVRLQAGSRLSGRVEFAKGEAVNPMSDADLVQKFMANCHVAKRTGDATEIADTIMRIDLLPSVAELGTLLRQPS